MLEPRDRPFSVGGKHSMTPAPVPSSGGPVGIDSEIVPAGCKRLPVLQRAELREARPHQRGFDEHEAVARDAGLKIGGWRFDDPGHSRPPYNMPHETILRHRSARAS